MVEFKKNYVILPSVLAFGRYWERFVCQAMEAVGLWRIDLNSFMAITSALARIRWRSVLERLGEKDQTKLIENQMTKCLRGMKNENVTFSVTSEFLKSIFLHISLIYGLPKVHKTGAPLGPILGMSNSAHHLFRPMVGQYNRIILEIYLTTQHFGFLSV